MYFSGSFNARQRLRLCDALFVNVLSTIQTFHLHECKNRRFLQTADKGCVIACYCLIILIVSLLIIPLSTFMKYSPFLYFEMFISILIICATSKVFNSFPILS